MNNQSPEVLCAVVLILAAIFFIAGFSIGKTEGYRNGYLGAYEHILKELKEKQENRSKK